jgi:hypothetical protein
MHQGLCPTFLSFEPLEFGFNNATRQPTQTVTATTPAAAIAEADDLSDAMFRGIVKGTCCFLARTAYAQMARAGATQTLDCGYTQERHRTSQTRSVEDNCSM